MEFRMRESIVLRKLRAGEIVSCFKLNLNDGQVADLAAGMGFDCLWTDMEHQANDWDVIKTQCWAAKSHGTDLMVRVSRGSYSDYIKPLELDATGILVPHIMNLSDARRVVEMTRFHPAGRRPVDGGNADGFYTSIDFKEYLKQANDQRFVVLQIEDPEPLDELEEIAALEGYDILFFGPGDFSHGIGAPGDWDNPRLKEARELVARTARKHGKHAATTCSIDKLQEYVNLGYNFLNVGADVVGLTAYCSSLLKSFRQTDKNLRS